MGIIVFWALIMTVVLVLLTPALRRSTQHVGNKGDPDSGDAQSTLRVALDTEIADPPADNDRSGDVSGEEQKPPPD